MHYKPVRRWPLEIGCCWCSREQPRLGDVPLTTDGPACCLEALRTEQSRSVYKGVRVIHSANMFLVWSWLAQVSILTPTPGTGGSVCPGSFSRSIAQGAARGCSVADVSAVNAAPGSSPFIAPI